MKKGDLLEFSIKSIGSSRAPMALLIDQRSPESDYHHRIRVLWLGDKLPLQAGVTSVSGERLSTWISPKLFIVASNQANSKN